MSDNPQLKVGDELAFACRIGRPWIIRKVTNITPTGRIKAGEYDLNPDLTIRGSSKGRTGGPFRALVVTEDIRAECRRYQMVITLEKVAWHKLPDDKLMRIVNVLQEQNQTTDTDNP